MGMVLARSLVILSFVRWVPTKTAGVRGGSEHILCYQRIQCHKGNHFGVMQACLKVKSCGVKVQKKKNV